MLIEYLLHIRVKPNQINMNRPIDDQEADIIGYLNRQFADNTGISINALMLPLQLILFFSCHKGYWINDHFSLWYQLMTIIFGKKYSNNIILISIKELV